MNTYITPSRTIWWALAHSYIARKVNIESNPQSRFWNGSAAYYKQAICYYLQTSSILLFDYLIITQHTTNDLLSFIIIWYLANLIFKMNYICYDFKVFVLIYLKTSGQYFVFSFVHHINYRRRDICYRHWWWSSLRKCKACYNNNNHHINAWHLNWLYNINQVFSYTLLYDYHTMDCIFLYHCSFLFPVFINVNKGTLFYR